MTKKWEDKSLFLQAVMRIEFKHWDSFPGEDRTIEMPILSFTHKKNNYRINIVFKNWKNEYIEITILEKLRKKDNTSIYNGFIPTKKNKFTAESQNEEIMKNLRLLKKEIELKELF